MHLQVGFILPFLILIDFERTQCQRLYVRSDTIGDYC